MSVKRIFLSLPVPLRRSYTLSPYASFSSRSSDTFLGQSPMAPAVPLNPGEKSGIPTAQEITTLGGVWAPTSAKRDKMVELRGALEEGQTSLDDAATPEQFLDLYLADGISCIVNKSEKMTINDDATMNDLLEWFEKFPQDLPEELAQVQWENFLTSVAAKVDQLLDGLTSNEDLQLVRDFMEPPVINEPPPDWNDYLASSEDDNSSTLEALYACVLRYRLHLVKTVAKHLHDNWTTLVTVTSGDLDRAAVKGTTLPPKASELSRDKLIELLKEFAQGSCTTRVDALWNLVDRDDDGLLDEVEMSTVATFSVTPVALALQSLTLEAIAARPVRQPLESNDEQKKLGMWERRRQQKAGKKLQKLLDTAVKGHFADEAEMPHRLRCIYAWAEKKHQDNKIDSIHVESGGGIVGRKRYVELAPKISLPEFREVQQEHFTHLDRVGDEVTKSFRENILVDQGNGRLSKELWWNTAYFMGAVCLVDGAIYFL